MNRLRTAEPRRRDLIAAAGLTLLIVSLAGCVTSGSASDPDEGRKALTAALDAWKAGAKPESLAAGTPPIHVADSDWSAGFKLLNYKSVDEGKLVGSDVNYAVALELKDVRGKASKRDAVYVVTTHPQLLVLRQENP